LATEAIDVDAISPNPESDVCAAAGTDAHTAIIAADATRPRIVM
jgi:hypothetical protein